MRYRNLIGTRYLGLFEGPGDGDETLKPGSTIPVERTQPPLNTWPSHVLGSSNVMSWSPVGSVIGWHMMRSEIARRFSRGT